MYNRIIALCLSFAFVCITAGAQIPINNGDGATIEDLIREKTLVTIMLNENAHDSNLQITRLNKNTITFIDADGRRSAYTVSAIKYIRVQEKRTAQKESIFSKGTLSREEQEIVDRARERIFELLKTETDPNDRMPAACLATVIGGDGGTGLGYLQRHAQGNDTPTAVLAATYLHLAGEPIDEDLLIDGFLHGNRATRVQTAVLAGLYGGESFLKDLRYMADDPHPEVNPSAIRALARIGDSWVIPKLYDGLGALKKPKSEASIYGLSKLGNEEVIKELKERMPLAGRSEAYRMLRVLYALGDEEAVKQMREVALSEYAYEKTTGLLLGENDDWDGGVWIREYLKRSKDPDYKNLLFEANLAAALYGTAQSQAKIVFQNLMRMNETKIFAKGNTSNTQYKEAILAEVRQEVCRLLGEQGDKTMLSLLYSPMESKNTKVALAACDAIVMIANAPYRERVIEYNQYTGYREELLPDFFK